MKKSSFRRKVQFSNPSEEQHAASSARAKVGFAAEQDEDAAPDGHEKEAEENRKIAPIRGEAELHTRGLKRSVYQQAQRLFSTAVPHLDVLLGGGVPLGCVWAIEEDALGYHADLLARYWQSDAMQYGHALVYADAEGRAADFQRWSSHLFAPLQASSPSSVPGVAATAAAEEEETLLGQSPTQKMEIAWRYEHLPTTHAGTNGKASSSTKSAAGTQKTFDITKPMPSSYIDANRRQTHLIDLSEERDRYAVLLERLQRIVDDQLRDDSVPMRICIQSFASPYWSDTIDSSELYRCLSLLRQLVSGKTVSILLTVCSRPYGVNPRRLLEPARHPRLSRLIHATDAWLSLYGFVGTQYENSPAYADWSGSLKVVKTFRETETAEWVYKIRRKRWTLERFVLPPEDDRTQGTQISLQGGNNDNNGGGEGTRDHAKRQQQTIQSTSTAPRQTPCGSGHAGGGHAQRSSGADMLDF